MRDGIPLKVSNCTANDYAALRPKVFYPMDDLRRRQGPTYHLTRCQFCGSLVPCAHQLCSCCCGKRYPCPSCYVAYPDYQVF